MTPTQEFAVWVQTGVFGMSVWWASGYLRDGRILMSYIMMFIAATALANVYVRIKAFE